MAGQSTRVRWGLPDVLVAWIVGSVVAVIAVTPFTEEVRGSLEVTPDGLLVALVVQAAVFVGWLGFVAVQKGLGSLRADFGLGIRLRDWYWLAAGAGVGLLAIGLITPIVEIGDISKTSQEVTKTVDEASGLTAALLAVAVVIVAPVAEELLFRGALLRGLLRRTAPWKAVLGSALVFALVHLADPGAGYAIPAFVLLGWISGWRAFTTGSLSQSILLHAGFNLLTVVSLLA